MTAQRSFPRVAAASTLPVDAGSTARPAPSLAGRGGGGGDGISLSHETLTGPKSKMLVSTADGECAPVLPVLPPPLAVPCPVSVPRAALAGGCAPSRGA